jgi:hypothetical protein
MLTFNLEAESVSPPARNGGVFGRGRATNKLWCAMILAVIDRGVQE